MLLVACVKPAQYKYIRLPSAGLCRTNVQLLPKADVTRRIRLICLLLECGCFDVIIGQYERF